MRAKRPYAGRQRALQNHGRERRERGRPVRASLGSAGCHRRRYRRALEHKGHDLIGADALRLRRLPRQEVASASRRWTRRAHCAIALPSLCPLPASELAPPMDSRRREGRQARGCRAHARKARQGRATQSPRASPRIVRRDATYAAQSGVGAVAGRGCCPASCRSTAPRPRPRPGARRPCCTPPRGRSGRCSRPGTQVAPTRRAAPPSKRPGRPVRPEDAMNPPGAPVRQRRASWSPRPWPGGASRGGEASLSPRLARPGGSARIRGTHFPEDRYRAGCRTARRPRRSAGRQSRRRRARR